MPCYHPLLAWRDSSKVNPKTGKSSLVFTAPANWRECEPLKIPCGQCVGCRLERSRVWAVRCVHEASLHERNCFITLTYNDENLPSDRSLKMKHYQDFMKRLRKRYGEGIRFFHCGEYGSLNQRPHYHAILFNHDFEDKKLWKVNNGFKLYVSDSLSRLWPFGYASIGDVSFESAAYVARYVLKKVTGDAQEAHYKGRQPEYVTMSRRPGIAHEWFLRYKNDIFPNDKCVIRDGLLVRPPRYYDKIFDEIDPIAFKDVLTVRKLKALKSDQTVDYIRLGVKEKCKNKQLKSLIRPIEM